MARPYAVDADLVALIPDILEHGVLTWAPELALASSDVLNKIKAGWWPQAVAQTYGALGETVDFGPTAPTLDEANINDAALKLITCYRALEHYIFPKLSADQDDNGNAFTRKAERYANFFQQEWEVIKNLPLYDFNGDAQFTDIERRGPIRRRLHRG